MSVGEEAAASQKFWSAPGNKPPVVTVRETSDLVKKLSVYAFPTVVMIDREGKVATYEVGVRGDVALRADLAKAGIGR